MKRNLITGIFLATSLHFSAFAAENGKLSDSTVKIDANKKTAVIDSITIGSKAPQLKYSKWIKGKPFQIEKNGMFIVEFWATWCGPCISNMPRLSKLAEEYKGKISVVSVNVWEKVGTNTYESSLPKVEKFVAGMGEKMSFGVAADNNDEYMVKNWLKAANITGIPQAFFIKDEKVMWIGHPIKLDSVVKAVEDGTYDIVAAKKTWDESVKKYAANAQKTMKYTDPIEAAIKSKNYKLALELIDKYTAEAPMIKPYSYKVKLEILFETAPEKEAMEFAKKWKDEDQYAAIEVASVIVNRPKLSKDSYLLAVEGFKKRLEDQRSATIFLFHHDLATAYAMAGMTKEAIASQEKAIELGKESLSKGMYSGALSQLVLDDYAKELERYKSLVK